MIRAGNNDTSVIRSPAVKKAGRLDSYGAVRKPPPDGILRGVVDKCEKDHNFCGKVAGDFIFSGFSLHPVHIRRKIDDERKLGLPKRGYLYGKFESI